MQSALCAAHGLVSPPWPEATWPTTSTTHILHTTLKGLSIRLYYFVATLKSIKLPHVCCSSARNRRHTCARVEPRGFMCMVGFQAKLRSIAFGPVVNLLHIAVYLSCFYLFCSWHLVNMCHLGFLVCVEEYHHDSSLQCIWYIVKLMHIA